MRLPDSGPRSRRAFLDQGLRAQETRFRPDSVVSWIAFETLWLPGPAFSNRGDVNGGREWAHNFGTHGQRLGRAGVRQPQSDDGESRHSGYAQEVRPKRRFFHPFNHARSALPHSVDILLTARVLQYAGAMWSKREWLLWLLAVIALVVLSWAIASSSFFFK